MTTRYHGYIIGDKSDKGQDAVLRVEMGNPIAMEIKGAKSGEDVTYTLSWLYSLFTSSEEKLELCRKFRTTNIAVALPAIVGAKMCNEVLSKRRRIDDASVIAG